MERKLGHLSGKELSAETDKVLIKLEAYVYELYTRAQLASCTEQLYTELLDIAVDAREHFNALKEGDVVTGKWIVTRDAITRLIEQRMEEKIAEQ
ncbi:hypothetical protein EPA93_44180 [Ktedonosporobacter rubrisoli]|uniref:Uncharacterized protein n=1 Tax=Ktedonosporobacter rubrisoli TaxID=2509675 RepID=A0A4P6K3H5_KTERU|nr:hypothetical protein [Ktedonosporobacter rubrisoli]QBD82595.1 hypothetical protein EPA93_44180 [Ktedonosporobacter rubrisoli]